MGTKSQAVVKGRRKKSMSTESTFKQSGEFEPWEHTQDLGPLIARTGNFAWIKSVSLSSHASEFEEQGCEWSRGNTALGLTWQGAETWLRHLPGVMNCYQV